MLKRRKDDIDKKIGEQLLILLYPSINDVCNFYYISKNVQQRSKITQIDNCISQKSGNSFIQSNLFRNVKRDQKFVQFNGK